MEPNNKEIKRRSTFSLLFYINRTKVRKDGTCKLLCKVSIAVSGRSDIQDFEEVVKLDCEYIDEWSPFLDIQILFKTVGVVLTHKGAE